VLEEIHPDADENENENEDEDEGAMEEDTIGTLESLLHSSRPHGNARQGKPSIQEVTDSASTPTPSTQGIKRQAEDGVEDLKEVVKNSKWHGKGPRGRPDIEEVVASGGTPTPGQGEIGR